MSKTTQNKESSYNKCLNQNTSTPNLVAFGKAALNAYQPWNLNNTVTQPLSDNIQCSLSPSNSLHEMSPKFLNSFNQSRGKSDYNLK